MTLERPRAAADDEAPDAATGGQPLTEGEYRAWLTRLAPEPAIRATCLVLTADVALGYLAFHWLAAGTWPRYFAPLLLAQVLLHFYLLQHEMVHGSALRGRWNAVLGCLLGIVLLHPFHARRSSHQTHHRAPGHLQNDPTNARAAARFGALGPRRLRLLEAAWRCGVPILVLNERLGLLRTCFVRKARQPSVRSDRLCMGLALLLYTSAAVHCIATPRLHFTLAAYFMAFATLLVMEEAGNLPHHLFARLQDEALPPWEQMLATHSCRPLPIWSRFVMLNFGAHTAHHVFSTVPWTRLPEVERELARRGAVACSSNEFAASCALRRRAFSDVFAGYLGRSE